MATSLNISDGRKEFHINGDPNRTIWINTIDAGTITRAKKEIGKLNAIHEEVLKAEQGDNDEFYFDILENAETALKNSINMIFAADIADTVFGLLSPLAIVREDGTTYYEEFINAIMPIIERDCTAAQLESKRRVTKHIGKYINGRDGA